MNRRSLLLGAAGLLPLVALAGMIAVVGPGSRYYAEAPSGDDWATRSTATGVVLADRLETQETINDWLLADGEADHISLDTTNKVDGAAGSLRFDVLSTDTSSSGILSVPFGTSFGEGDTLWFSYRYRPERHHAFQPWDPSPGDGGAKMSILSRDTNGASPTGSNQVNEVVVQFNYQGGVYDGYNRDAGGGYVGWVTAAATDCSGADFKFQTAIDNGANPLSGTDPDTGSAWSACQQDRRQFGSLYAAQSESNYRPGLGDPLAGGVKPSLDEFDTITGRVEIVNFGGSTGNRITIWVAKPGQPYVRIVDQDDVSIGDGPDYNGMSLLPYVTDRTATGRRVTSRETDITGVEILNVGGSTATGDGELEYNATTGRFRWHGSGESFGTARGHSASNDILLLNVAAASPTNSFVVLLVDPDALPSSGTTTDTVTIASGRADTWVNYNDVIVSTQAINAPGGYAPVLP